MMESIAPNFWVFWTVVTVACLIMELTSGDFYITCFALGAIGGVVAAVFGLPFWLQVVVWAVGSILSIWLIRPHLVRAVRRGGEERKSNADALMGQVGEVSQMIVSGGYGRVKLDGDDWKAEAPSLGEDIEVGAKVRVIGRESIILRVERA